MKGFPHGLYLSDLHVLEDNRSLFTAVFGAALGVFVRGHVHVHFRTVAQAERALVKVGFREGRLISPADAGPLLDGPLLPGAKLVRVIDAGT
jgi:hypothetical protein